MSTETQVPVRFEPHTRVRDIVGLYFRFGSPRLLVGLLLAAVIARLVVGRWSWWDLVVVVVMIAAQPFVEWLIHTFILHFKPRQLRGRVLDLHIAQRHRSHHLDPKNVAGVFIPLRPLILGIPILIVAVLLIFPLSIALTILVVQFAIGNIYEWTHFYIHSGCKPRNRYAAYIEKAHRLHHYRNEKFWMGVTNHTADHVLGTFPQKDDVPASPTAKTLGIAQR